MASFNGLGMHMGNLATFRRGKPLDQPGKSHRRKGEGRDGDTDPARSPAQKLGRDGKSRPTS